MRKWEVWVLWKADGGGVGIRTLDGLVAHTHLAGEHLRPLGHSSVPLFILAYLLIIRVIFLEIDSFPTITWAVFEEDALGD